MIRIFFTFAKNKFGKLQNLQKAHFFVTAFSIYCHNIVNRKELNLTLRHKKIKKEWKNVKRFLGFVDFATYHFGESDLV